MGGYVVSILDCCREPVNEATRGGGGAADDENDDLGDSATYQNCITYFGCPAG